MRTLVITLALLGACGGDLASDAPSIDPVRSQRSVPDRLDALEAQTATLTKQLAAAQATIATLQRQLTEVDGAVFETDPETGARVNKVDALTIKQKITENAVGELRDAEVIFEAALKPTCGDDFSVAALRGGPGSKYEEISFKCGTGMSRLATLEGVAQDNATAIGAVGEQQDALGRRVDQNTAAIDALDATVFEDDAAAGRVSKIDAISVKQKVTEDAVGELGKVTGYTGEIASSALDYLLALVAGPGRQGGHLVTTEDYQRALAQAGVPGAPAGFAEELRHALFESDPETGAEVPRVDGAGLALATRLRKRPEILHQAWDDLIAERVTELRDNPLFAADRSASNPLFAMGERIDGIAHFIDDWQGEVAYLSTRIDDHVVWTTSLDERVSQASSRGEPSADPQRLDVTTG